MAFDFSYDDNHRNKQSPDGSLANRIIEDMAVGASAGGIARGAGFRGYAIGAAAGLGYGMIMRLGVEPHLGINSEPGFGAMIMDDIFAGAVAGGATTRSWVGSGIGAAAGLSFGLFKHVLVEKTISEPLSKWAQSMDKETPQKPPVFSVLPDYKLQFGPIKSYDLRITPDGKIISAPEPSLSDNKQSAIINFNPLNLNKTDLSPNPIGAPGTTGGYR